MARALLQGASLPRPLFVPIVFSLGARLENVPLRVFLTNPTKISNSLRQIRGHLRSDGVTCYFDPCLEAEAVGGILEWTDDDRPPSVNWPESAEKGELPRGLRSPEETAKSGRVPVTAEVIRQLKYMLGDDSLLMVCVSGPLTFAARLAQLEQDEVSRLEDLPEDALEFAASVNTQVASTLVDAGANLIFVREEILPRLSAESCETWASLLETALNVVRFYDALPVLQLADGRSARENREVILERPWKCVVCVPLEALTAPPPRKTAESSKVPIGIAVQLEGLQESSGMDLSLLRAIAEWQPAIVTSTGDIPATADLKRLTSFREEIARAAAGAGA